MRQRVARVHLQRPILVDDAVLTVDGDCEAGGVGAKSGHGRHAASRLAVVAGRHRQPVGPHHRLAAGNSQLSLLPSVRPPCRRRRRPGVVVKTFSETI